MQNSVPKGEGGMVAVLGATIEDIENILNENKEIFKVEIANDNFYFNCFQFYTRFLL